MSLISILTLILLIPVDGIVNPVSQENGPMVDTACMKNLPLYFIENQGQVDDEVAFYVKGADKTIYFTSDGITFSLQDANQRCNVQMNFVDANPRVVPFGEAKQEAVFSYFKGKPEDWNAGIPTFSKIVYENLWAGIDLVYSGTVNQLKYDFIVKPGADPKMIRFNVSGASDVVLSESGGLQIETPIGSFEDDTPTAYQKVDGNQIDVAVNYSLSHPSSSGHFSVGFDLGAYDPLEVLVIDPVVLVYCGFIGGGAGDNISDITVDKDGHAYICGRTKSSEEVSFPVSGGFDLSFNGLDDAYIAKLSSSGDSLVYCSYLGGENLDNAGGIAIDDQGNAYLSGATFSSESEEFPVVVGPDLTFNGELDGFIAKVSPSGTNLLYCGYIGGSKGDFTSQVAVNSQGNAFITGTTSSSEDDGFPVMGGPDLTYNGEYDAYVAKIACNGTHYEYCGYIGGTRDDFNYGIAIDEDDSAYVAGLTDSSERDGFPVLIGPDISHNGNSDGFVAKLAASGAALVYCGYIGGTKNDSLMDIAVEGKCAYVVGDTDSVDLPVIIGPTLFYKGGQKDGYLAKVAITGNSLVYCGYIGGSRWDEGQSIAVDSDGCAYVTGNTESSQNQGFPILLGPDITFNSLDYFDGDAYLAKVSRSGDSFEYCGYIGGWYVDMGFGVAVDMIGNAYVAGITYSSPDEGFPALVGPDLTFNGDQDGFIAKVAFSLTADNHSISTSTGGTIHYQLYTGYGNHGREYLMLGSFHGSEPGLPLPNGGETLPLVWDSLTDYILAGLNGPIFTNFQAALNEYSQGTAVLNCPPLRPYQIGKVMTLAYCLEGNPNWDFVSNPVEIEFVP